MKKILIPVVLIVLIAPILVISYLREDKKASHSEKTEGEGEDYFFQSHGFPYGKIDYDAQKKAAQSFKNTSQLRKSQTASWEFAGPVNIGGRIVDIEFDPTNQQKAYLAAASGGIFKTIDGGENWLPIFDNETTLSIGDIAVAPSSPNIIYVGTGEPNGGSGSLTYDANGIYKSTDAGSTWANVGLQNTRMTGHLAVHPTNPDIVFAACMGDLYAATPDRGLYKTTNGGLTWTNVLFVDDSTGAIDVVINPQNPNIVFAATWKRSRYVNSKDYAGVQSGLWKSEDGGNSFSRLGQSNGLPPVGVEYSRIGVDLCASSPNVVYCLYENEQYGNLGLFKSEDSGNNWVQTYDYDVVNSNGNTQSYWYGRLKCDPTDPNILYVIGFDLLKTIDGGNSYSLSFDGAHVDQHAVAIHPLNHNFVMAGNDGGLYISEDGGFSYNHHESLPISQIYRGEIDFSEPSNLYFGLQDNGTSYTPTGNNNDYSFLFGGDGFQSLVYRPNNSIILVGYQYGNIFKTTTKGTNWEPSTNGVFGIGNWNYPLVADPQVPSLIYTGTQHVFQSTDFGSSWFSISPELTSIDTTGTLLYGTITFIDVSPIDSEIIYAGTDDGKVWNTINGGNTWNQINSGLPLRWVTCVMTDPFDQNTAYVTFSGYRFHDPMSHVYKTTDNGQTWTDIGSNLPDIPCNNIIADPSIPNVLYLATDIGVYYTRNGGANWTPMTDGMPIVVCSDLKLHQPSRTLVVGTYGRSSYKLDLNLFLGLEKVNNLSTDFSVSPNPVTSEGATLNYNLLKPAEITISIYNIEGKSIFVNKNKSHAGKNSFPLDLKNASAGIYLINLKNGTESTSKKIILN